VKDAKAQDFTWVHYNKGILDVCDWLDFGIATTLTEPSRSFPVCHARGEPLAALVAPFNFGPYDSFDDDAPYRLDVKGESHEGHSVLEYWPSDDQPAESSSGGGEYEWERRFIRALWVGFGYMLVVGALTDAASLYGPAESIAWGAIAAAALGLAILAYYWDSLTDRGGSLIARWRWVRNTVYVFAGMVALLGLIFVIGIVSTSSPNSAELVQVLRSRRHSAGRLLGVGGRGPSRWWQEHRGTFANLAVQRWLAGLSRAGRLRVERKQRLQREQEHLDNLGACRSNDTHVLALARASGARLLFSRDQALHADFWTGARRGASGPCVADRRVRTSAEANALQVHVTRRERHCR
jgi:hypothetical protein